MAEGAMVVILKLVVELVKQPESQGLVKTFKNFVFGKKILLAGPSRAGKTTFIDYLRHGQLEPVRTHLERTAETTPSASFAVEKTESESLHFRVRTALDVAGHSLPRQQAELLSEQPDAIIILLDASESLDVPTYLGQSPRQWLESYSDHLSDELVKDPEAAAKLQCMLVIMNKVDLAEEATVTMLEKAVKGVFDARLKRGWGMKILSIPVLPCILVENPHGTIYIDRVIRELARCME